jgi:hypothetical protein
MRNADFAEQDEMFRLACEAAGLEPTRRQASKFNREQGLAWKWYVTFGKNRKALEVYLSCNREEREEWRAQLNLREAA